MKTPWRLIGSLCAIWFFGTSGVNAAEIRIGVKTFTESVILSEMMAQLAKSTGAELVYQKQLGGTRILWNALRNGEIDAYPEYTGTISNEIFAGAGLDSDEAIRKTLEEEGIRMSRPLGFNNTYALGMKKDVAQKKGIRTIQDLKEHPGFRFGFSNEFMDRADGWPGLRDLYQLPQRDVRGLNHDLAYRGLGRTLDVIDLYSTDAEIAYYDLLALEDNQAFFPEYNAVILYRADLTKRAPEVVSALLKLEDSIPDKSMIRMNARAKLDRIPERRVAADFLVETFNLRTETKVVSVFDRLVQHTSEHIQLVMISLTGAILVSLPLGILAARFRRFGRIILSSVALIQTIPSLALLVFMIPFFGIGGPPAVMALFLYSLLPIVRNTHAGLEGIPVGIRESAEALGLPGPARIRIVELPIAAPTILAGIKTSAVINVGTATLGALIGAGGFGQPILTGIRLDNLELILQGAVPAAILALLVQGFFELIEHFFVPKGLRLKPESG